MSQETYNLSDDLKKTLHDLASLSNHKNSKVALSARQVRGHQLCKLYFSLSGKGSLM